MEPRRAWCVVLSALTICSCVAIEDDPLWSSDPELTRDPTGGLTLVGLSDRDVADAMGWAGLEVPERRARGVETMIRELAAALSARGISAAPLEQIDPAFVEAAPPLSFEEEEASGAIGSTRYALEESDRREYYYCPVLAPETNAGTSCSDLVDAVVVKVRHGIEALRAWDSPERGGNGDGLIDARDRVFEQLRIWVDGDHDGLCTPHELGELADHGILAFRLSAKYQVERRREGSITARLDVLTEQGRRDAYDVWFKLDLKVGGLSSLLPR